MNATPWPRERSIAVVGAGAIGCRIAAHFAQRGVASTLFDGWREHVDALNARGLRLEYPDGRSETFATTACDLAVKGPSTRFDLVLLAVRSDETKAVLPLVKRLLRDDGCVLSCQNGLNEEVIAEAVGRDRTLGCSLVFGAKLHGPGVVRILAGPDVLRTGEYVGGHSPRLAAIVDLLGACGHSGSTSDLLGYRWMKLALNATGNTLLLITGLTARDLYAHEAARRLAIGLVREVLGTALALGITPEPVLEARAADWVVSGAEQDTRLHHALTRHGASLGARRLSMVADFEARGRTEVDYINGYVVRKARSLGRAVPLNDGVLRLVHEMEAGSRQPCMDALSELAGAQKLRKPVRPEGQALSPSA